MSDTPRTDLNILTIETIRTLPGSGVMIVLAAVMRQLERELNESNRKIAILKSIGNELYDCASQLGYTSSGDSKWIRKAEKAIEDLDKEKDSK